MPSYERIKSWCLHTGELWEDPEFPAIMSSIFYHQIPPFQFVWKRPREIFPNPVFLSDRTNYNVVSGRMGDKWLVSCMGVIFTFKGLLFRAVPENQSMEEGEYTGMFRFNIWYHGQWKEVLLDDRLPTIDGKLVFLQMENTQELWPALLEKAYAKVLGSYEALKYGNLMNGLADLTSGITEKIDNQAASKPDDIKRLLVPSTIVIASFSVQGRVNFRGLETGIEYIVRDIIRVSTSRGLVDLLRLQKPMRTDSVHVNRIIGNPNDWLYIPDDLNYKNCVLMMFSDFIRLQPTITCLHLEETSISDNMFSHNKKWKEAFYHGSWKKGVSAGGCKNKLASYYHTNPQILIKLNEANDVLISLNQHRVMKAITVGFSVFNANKLSTDVANQAFFKKNKSIFTSDYMNSRWMTYKLSLSAGSYLIVPSTLEARLEGNFTLRLFTLNTIEIKDLDEQLSFTHPLIQPTPRGAEPYYFAFYESFFLYFADERRTVNVYELQEVLETCLPNDYLKSCSSLETCRQMILSLDKTKTGRLALPDFKDLICNLRHWQLVFKNHSKERTGVLQAERLQEALKDIGFTLPKNILSILIVRFMKKDGIFRFSDFVSVVLYLYRIFEMFLSNATETQVSTLAKWLEVALRC